MMVRQTVIDELSPIIRYHPEFQRIIREVGITTEADVVRLCRMIPGAPMITEGWGTARRLHEAIMEC